MRYDKAFYAPDEKFVFERVDLSAPKVGRVEYYHMRPSNAGIVCGEGYASAYSLPEGATRLYILDDGVYAYLGTQKALYNAVSKTTITGIASEPKALLPHATKAGVKGMYCVEENSTRYISSGTVGGASNVGGTCAAMHHGRLFEGNGTKLRFSAPFSTDGVLQTERSPDGAGYIDFESGKGAILAIVSFREKLYLFFERGIIRMRAEGEALDFKAEETPFRGGKVLAGSVAVCGDRICYMTQDGLFSFDGTCDFLEKQDDINLTAAISAYDYNGKYAAAVSLKTGRKAIYLYDFMQKTGRYLLVKGLLSGERENFLVGTTVYRITENGGVPLGYDCSMTLTLSTVPRALAWVRVEGDGEFEIRTNASSGLFSCAGGEKAHICAKKPLTETQIQITVKSSAFRIRAIDVAWRKDDGN